MNKLVKYINDAGILRGIFRFIYRLLKWVLVRINTVYWRFSLGELGPNSVIYLGVSIEKPRSCFIGANCRIEEDVRISSEGTGVLVIEDGCQINRDVLLDHTGNLTIKKNSLISEKSMIYTHDHGYDPRSVPVAYCKTVGECVWIGSSVIVLAKVRSIGRDSIIGSMSLVSKDIVEKTLNVGIPSKIIKKI
jgi:acetyltransferase-like isoleucine patch superfamily enzyme